MARNINHEVSTVQVPSNYRPSSVQVEKLVQLMHDEYLNVSKMMELCGIKHRMTFRDNYINPALSDGSIERKYPDQPNHPNRCTVLRNRLRYGS